MDAGDVHDPPPSAGVHPGQQPPGEQERRLEHESVHEPELLGLELLDRRDVLEAGVVDQDVRLEVERVDGAGVGEVQRAEVAVDRGGHLGGALAVAVQHDDPVTPLGEVGGHGSPDAARATGHQGGAAAPGRDVGLGHDHEPRGDERPATWP